MRYRCIIVDDDPISTSILTKYVRSVPVFDIVGTCNNSMEAYRLMITTKIDLAFLDIDMPILTGTELVKSLQQPPAVIFTTSHTNFAIEAFNLDAVDYLLKPFSFDRFLKALNKFTKMASGGNEPANGTLGHVYFRTNRKMVKIDFENILYLECLKDYVQIYRSHEPEVRVKQAFNSLEAILPHDIFLRVHRSFIVSKPKVTAFSSDFVEIGKLEIPIGRKYKHITAVLAGE